MKQYTYESQTAKLIALGLPRPRCLYDGVLAYNIGELIEMLPEAICTSHDDSCHYHLSMDTDACMWRVRYMDDIDVTLCATYGDELINVLYDMVIA